MKENDTAGNCKMESCVICGTETNEPVDRHIDRRHFYIEGAGQLCEYCYYKAYDMD